MYILPTDPFISHKLTFESCFSMQDYSLNMYLRQQWTDPRLKFKPFNGKEEQKIKLEDGMWNKIWTPDVFFRNEKEASFHDVTTPNRLLNLHNDGRVWYVSK